MNDIERKTAFILELEKLKAVLRKTRPVGLDRFENTAEHSWQTALTAMVFLEEADPSLNKLKVLKMLLIHDVVEIDAGDVFVYDDRARAEAEEIERDAARRIFGLLPEEQGAEMFALWEEFEARETPESVFAKAIDRVNPVIQNLNSSPNSWQEHGISRECVLAKNAEIANASQDLWKVLECGIELAQFSD
ncbi:MAG: HD domain-containing protein [Rhizobiaceae bacterium]